MVVQSQFWDNSKWLERLPFKLDLTHPFWRQVLFRQHFVSSSLGQLGQQTSSSTIPINYINTVNDIHYFWCLKPCQTPHFEYDGCIPFTIYIYIPDKRMCPKDLFLESGNQGLGDTRIQVLSGAPPAHSKCGVQPCAFGDRSALRASEWNSPWVP